MKWLVQFSPCMAKLPAWVEPGLPAVYAVAMGTMVRFGPRRVSQDVGAHDGRTRSRHIGVALCCLFVPFVTLPVHAQRHSVFSARGAGTSLCEEWTTARADHSAQGYEQWVLGFLSGISYMGLGELNPARAADANGVWSWTDTYCQVHPDHDIAKAATAFVTAHPR
jgi:hypothetical protein